MTLLLNDPQKAKSAVAALVGFAKKDGLDGIDLDFESLAQTDRKALSSFVTLLAKGLHAQKKLLSVTVHPKDSEPGNWDGPKAAGLEGDRGRRRPGQSHVLRRALVNVRTGTDCADRMGDPRRKIWSDPDSKGKARHRGCLVRI